MTYGDIDAMNDRALDSLDRLAEIGTYEHTQRLTMAEPLDEPVPSLLDETLVSYRVSDREALQNANQHDLQREYK